MKLCIAGKNNIAVDCLEYALSFLNKSEICVVLNKTDNLKNTWQKSLGFYANYWGVDICLLEEVQKLDNLIFLSLEYDRIINPESFNSDRLFNIHFSFLPEFKGMYTSLLPILLGKEYSGVTLHKIDNGIDTGDVIDQRMFNIREYNSKELYYKYLEEGTKLVCSKIISLCENKFNLEPQNSVNSTYFSKSSFNFSENSINPRQTAFQIQQFVKALNFRPYQLSRWDQSMIYKAEISENISIYKPGLIIRENIERIEISTIDYNVFLYKDYYNDLLNCCRNNNVKYASEIIDYIDDLNEFDRNGWNPLIVACYYGSSEVVRLLINNGANPHITNLNGTTTLMYSKEAFYRNNDLSIINLLLMNGVKVDSKDIFGNDIYSNLNNVKLSKFLKSKK